MRLNEQAARDRFAAARTVRLATVGPDGRPHLVPITFAVLEAGAAVAFAVDHKPKTTTRLRRVENIRANPGVCLLADEWSEDWTQLWWVRADGTARVLDDGSPATVAAVAALVERYEQYRQQPPAGAVVHIAVTRWTGWSGAAS
ncbi:MAG: TIGR03668 family PPOX class F420-dependent oxidoreductase [Actinobacteria bacterium]|nr:TIGR03668 family PPOX class F420-dependent oxidoreductase [Actinomycetota bacterium]